MGLHDKSTTEPSPARGRPRKHRPGVCHRCGWSGPVSKVRRADRRRTGTGRAFGRLCEECFGVLFGERPAASGTTPVAETERPPGRNVA